VTGEPLVSLDLVPNEALYARINTFGLDHRNGAGEQEGAPTASASGSEVEAEPEEE
jgi:hypothetical protein